MDYYELLGKIGENFPVTAVAETLNPKPYDMANAAVEAWMNGVSKDYKYVRVGDMDFVVRRISRAGEPKTEKQIHKETVAIYNKYIRDAGFVAVMDWEDDGFIIDVNATNENIKNSNFREFIKNWARKDLIKSKKKQAQWNREQREWERKQREWDKAHPDFC